jgi:GDPmannose 4,6-dehydratase
MTRSPPIAAILGGNGQDGHYLTAHLRRRGVIVHSYGRQPDSRWERFKQDPGFFYTCLNLAEVDAVSAELVSQKPDQIYYLAAVHGPSGFSYEDHWRIAHQVNTVTPHGVLETMRQSLPHSRFVYASSSKVFTAPYPIWINEESPRVGRCIYSITKNATTDLIDYYRSKHGLAATAVHLFNHESPLRKSGFFIPKLIAGLVNALENPAQKNTVGSLCFWCDWGSADEFMDILSEIGGQNTDNRDLCLGSGRTVWAEDLAEALFSAHGLDWHDHLQETLPRREKQAMPFQVSLDRLKQVVHRVPETSIEHLCNIILQENYPHLTNGRA